MRKLTLFMHLSLDGFAAGPNGEMDWIRVDDELFDYAGNQTGRSDLALYGRSTYDMMDAYWPTAGDSPDASKHDKEHSEWYNRVEKVVVSKTMQANGKPKLTVISDNVAERINALKQLDGAEITMFGSPGLAKTLLHHNLIDDYWLFINPVLLGDGIPLFGDIDKHVKLNVLESRSLNCGVVCLHYSKA
jgi:dihydrofolate reductase